MKLFYSPGACSLAPHIALREANLEFQIESVNLKAKKYSGGDYTTVNPKGSVPALQLDDGQVLTEAAVILQYIADRKPTSRLLPDPGSLERYRCLEWLNYIATEMHKGFGPLWSETTPAEYKQTVKEMLGKKFDYLSKHVDKGRYLMGDRFTVADCYAATVLNWTNFHKIDLSKWPKVAGYLESVLSRPSCQEAMKAEGLKKS